MLLRDARWIAGVFILCLAACATPPQTRLLASSPTDSLPKRVELVEAPFFPQDDFQCGPAALAMSLNAAGIAVTPETLKPEVYVPDRRGSFQIEMMAAARRHGAMSYQLAPELRGLLRELAAGTPVVVLQNLGLGWYPVWHYAVAIGYDLERMAIILRSGREQRQVLPLSTFEYTWARADYWAIVTISPDKIPETAEENSYIGAISALERTGEPLRAQIAYQAALHRWPKNPTAQIGVGNTAYKMNDLEQAEAAYRQAAQDHPESVAALNNLAQALSDLGRYDEALEVARRAVSLGGPLTDAAQETLSDIERKK